MSLKTRVKAGPLACPQPQPAGPVSLRDPGVPLFLTPWAGLPGLHFCPCLRQSACFSFIFKAAPVSKPLENLLLLKTAYRISTDSHSLFSCSPLRQVRTPVLRVFTLNHRK